MTLTVGVELIDSWEPVEVTAQPTRLVGIFGVQLQLKVRQSSVSLGASTLAPGPAWQLLTPLTQGTREDIPLILSGVPIIGPGTVRAVGELQGLWLSWGDMWQPCALWETVGSHE